MGAMLLIAGLLLWSGAHLGAAARAPLRGRLIDRIGIGPYKGIFSLVILLSIGLMVSGWQSMSPAPLYQPPHFLRHVTMLLMVFAVILFIGARFPSNIRHWLRHPQLTGVKTWALAHLLSNGEPRSLLLFGGLLAWAVLSVIVINRREGAWKRPAPAGFGATALHVGVGIALTAALVFAHPWIAGVPLVSSR